MAGKRKHIPKAVETAILTKSRRRCAVCFGLDGDLSRKKGQIAHLSQDSSRTDEDDLIFLCQDHHDEYDSKPSQTKGLTAGELREYRAQLHLAISKQEPSPPVGSAEAPASDPVDFLGEAVEAISRLARRPVAPPPSPSSGTSPSPESQGGPPAVTAEWVDGKVEGWDRASMQLDVYAQTVGPIRLVAWRFYYWPVGARALKRTLGLDSWQPRPIGEGREREAATVHFPLDWIPNDHRSGYSDAEGGVEIYAEVDYRDESTGRTGTATAGPTKLATIPPLPSRARKLLLGAAADRGHFLRVPAGMGDSTVTFQANGETLGVHSDPRSEAKWEAACERLEELDLVRGQGYQRQIFQLTEAGYKIADALGEAAPPEDGPA